MTLLYKMTSNSRTFVKNFTVFGLASIFVYTCVNVCSFLSNLLDLLVFLLCCPCRMYFNYIYKASINIIFLIKVTVNWHVIDLYINFYLIYNVTVFIFIQNFITCKIISYYYFNSKVSSFLNVNLLLVKQNHKALCFIFWTFKFVSLSAQRSKPTIKFWGDLTAVRNSRLTPAPRRYNGQQWSCTCRDCG